MGQGVRCVVGEVLSCMVRTVSWLSGGGCAFPSRAGWGLPVVGVGHCAGTWNAARPSSGHRIAGSGAHWMHVLPPCCAPRSPVARALCANPLPLPFRRPRVPTQGLGAPTRHGVRPAAAAGGRTAGGAARGRRCAGAAADCRAALARWQGGSHAALFAGCRCLAS